MEVGLQEHHPMVDGLCSLQEPPLLSHRNGPEVFIQVSVCRIFGGFFTQKLLFAHKSVVTRPPARSVRR